MRYGSQKISLWLQWILITCLSIFLGFVFIAALSSLFFPFIILIFLPLGLGQWIILRQRIPNAVYWIPATAIGANMGLLASSFIVILDLRNKGEAMLIESCLLSDFWKCLFRSDNFSITSGFFIGAFVGGTIVGCVQFLVLLDSCKRAFLWILVSGIAWMSSVSWLTFYVVKGSYSLEPLIWVVLGGTIKGIALTWILAPLERRKHISNEMINSGQAQR